MNITNLIQSHSIDQEELEVFLVDRFKGAEQTNSGEISFADIIRLKYKSDKSRIIEINIDETKLNPDKFIQELLDALKDNGNAVNDTIVFSYKKVSKSFRLDDDFQLLPPPIGSSLPPFQDAEHPFILQYSFKRSKNPELDRHRALKRERELRLLLNGILNVGLILNRRFNQYAWIVEIGNEGHWENKYKPLGYSPIDDKRDRDAKGFINIQEYPPFDRLKEDSYYSHRVRNPENELFLPDTFERLISKFHNLSTPDRQLFLRASYWAQVAKSVFLTSRSSAYASLVTSIEVLLPQPKDRCSSCGRPVSAESCTECHQPQAGPTKHFRDFVEQFSPGIDSKVRGRLYDTRSLITHGGRLLPSDLNQSLTFTPLENEAMHYWYLLSNLTQVLHVNWLHSRST